MGILLGLVTSEALWVSVSVPIAVTNAMIKSSLGEKVLPYMSQVHNPLREAMQGRKPKS